MSFFSKFRGTSDYSLVRSTPTQRTDLFQRDPDKVRKMYLWMSPSQLKPLYKLQEVKAIAFLNLDFVKVAKNVLVSFISILFL